MQHFPQHQPAKPRLFARSSLASMSITWWAALPFVLVVLLAGISSVTSEESNSLPLLPVRLIPLVLLVAVPSLAAYHISGKSRLVQNIVFCAISSVLFLGSIVVAASPLGEKAQERTAVRRALKNGERALKEAFKASQNPSMGFRQQAQTLSNAALVLFHELERVPGNAGRVGTHMHNVMREISQIREPFLLTTENFINSGGLDPQSLRSQSVCQQRMMQLVAMRATSQILAQASSNAPARIRELIQNEGISLEELGPFLQGFERGVNASVDLAAIQQRFINAAYDYIKVLHDYAGTWGIDESGQIYFSISAPIQPFNDAVGRLERAEMEEQAWINAWDHLMK